jgi:hypothetical protein
MATESSDDGGEQRVQAERRRWPRIPVTLPDSDDSRIRITGIPPPIRVLDLSRGGIRFTGPRLPKDGEVLVVWLYNQGVGAWLKLQVRVVHASALEKRVYQIGAAFVEPLSEADLQGLLGRPVVKPAKPADGEPPATGTSAPS